MKSNNDSDSDYLCSYLDMGYSHDLALRLEQFKTHPTLGFRTAGSSAEIAAGDMLYTEMKSIGLDAKKELIEVDGWEFKEATLEYFDSETRVCTLSAYQTNFVTSGFQDYYLVNVGKGTAEDFDKVDCRGKIALIFINQRDEWWINYPTYQAHLRGAVAVIAVQNSGFGEVNSNALNAQDICGPCSAPAFSMSNKDAKKLIAIGATAYKQIKVRLKAFSKVTPKTKTYNIVGTIKGKSDNMIMVSAHYDSYFKGFQDDNTGVSMMLCMARAIIKGGITPNKTLVFVAFAAEEWGTIDSRYDWSAGAYAFLATSHPEFRGKIIADINLELPAFSHGAKHYIRCVYEYKSYLKKFIELLPKDVRALYPKGVAVVCPVQSWSDDFCLATAGVPSMVNEFKLSTFMETHYHSQFDNDNCYNEKIYYFHHQLYLRALWALDGCKICPINFGTRFKEMGEELNNQNINMLVEGDFRKSLDVVRLASKRLYRKIKKYNLGEEKSVASVENIENKILKVFKNCEKRFVSLDWYEKAIFPYVNVQNNIALLSRASWQVYNLDFRSAINTLIEIDDNSYAEVFDREVTDYFIRRALNEGKEVTKWGAGKLKSVGHLDLFDMIARLKVGAKTDASKIINKLQALKNEEQARLERILTNLTEEVSDVTRQINDIAKLF